MWCKKIEQCEKVFKCPVAKKKEGLKFVRICPPDKVFILGKCVKEKYAPGQFNKKICLSSRSNK